MHDAMLKLYAYHAWANADLFGKLEMLDPERQADALHAALRLINHAHVVSRIFAGNLTGTRHGYQADNTEETPTLDELRHAVSISDHWYLDYLRSVSPADLLESIRFTFTDGDSGCMTREEMLTHVVLHAGYHRGEAGRLLSQLGVTPPWDTFAVYLHRSEPQRRAHGDAVAATA